MYFIKKRNLEFITLRTARVLAACVCAAAFIFASCAKMPTEEMGQAEEAVVRAENDPDAKQYAQADVARARESLNNMQDEAAQKHYEQAKQLASETIALADKAISNGKAGAARIRSEADSAIRAMENSLSETQLTIDGAKSAGRSTVNFAEIDSEYATALSGAEQARQANTSGNYRQAVDLSASVRTSLSNITERIGQAAQAQNRKK
jgi:hypothetical protein